MIEFLYLPIYFQFARSERNVQLGIQPYHCMLRVKLLCNQPFDREIELIYQSGIYKVGCIDEVTESYVGTITKPSCAYDYLVLRITAAQTLVIHLIYIVSVMKLVKLKTLMKVSIATCIY